MAETKSPRTTGRRRRGFERTSNLLERKIRDVGETRGFAVTRLLTHWAEIVGTETAAVTRPVNVSYAKGGFGATLTVLTAGAHAPMIEAQLPKIKERVNACYGYGAISRIRLTQTAPTGFSEGAADFSPAVKPEPKVPAPQVQAAAAQTTKEVGDDSLRLALTRLGANVMSKDK